MSGRCPHAVTRPGSCWQLCPLPSSEDTKASCLHLSPLAPSHIPRELLLMTQVGKTSVLGAWKMGDLTHDAAPHQGQGTLLALSSAQVSQQGPPRPQAGVPLSWSWSWSGPAAPRAPRARLAMFPTSNSMATELPVPAGTRGHWDPILAPGSGLGLAGVRRWGGGFCQAVGRARTRTPTTQQSWPRQAGLYLTHVHKYSSGGRNTRGEGLCCSPEGPTLVVSMGSLVDLVQASPQE